MLLLHGWGCKAGTFKSLQNELSKTHKVFAVDFPGFGKSEEPKTVWGCSEYAAWTEQFVRKLGITNPIVLGHSFGGRVALILNSKIAINKLILTGGAGLMINANPQKKKGSGFIGSMKSLLEKALPKEGYEMIKDKFIESVGSADYKNASPMMREILKKVIGQDLTDYASKIRVPTLLIWGENDADTPVEMGKAFNRLIPASELIILNGCGHYAFLDNEREFLALTNNLITKN